MYEDWLFNWQWLPIGHSDGPWAWFVTIYYADVPGKYKRFSEATLFEPL